jgi:predicted nucleic acid-binding protein
LPAAGIYTVDASVFLNAFNPYEDGHEESRSLLARFAEDSTPIIVPNLLRVEVAAAVSRGRGNASLARRFADTLMRLPHLVVIPLDDRLAAVAAALAADQGLRGADAVYGAVAVRFGSALVTRDGEQSDRLAAVITTLRPSEVQ